MSRKTLRGNAVYELRQVARRFGAGFTLVELMVAVSGGIFVSMAVFLLAKNSTTLYQQETRLGSATMQGILGFDRLSTDIAQAGFLSTPNIAKDPNVCRGTSSLPAGMLDLASILIEAQTSTELPAIITTGNGFAPMTIRLAGS
jgi:Tfp pilus assembly protein PilW